MAAGAPAGLARGRRARRRAAPGAGHGDVPGGRRGRGRCRPGDLERELGRGPGPADRARPRRWSARCPTRAGRSRRPTRTAAASSTRGARARADPGRRLERALGGPRPATELRTGGQIVRTHRRRGAARWTRPGVDLARPAGRTGCSGSPPAGSPRPADEVDVNHALACRGLRDRRHGSTLGDGRDASQWSGSPSPPDVRTAPVVIGPAGLGADVRPADAAAPGWSVERR